MSYPSPVSFRKIDPGRGGVAIRWRELADSADGAVNGYAVYRASRPIEQHESEAFYAGLLGPSVVRFLRPASPPAFFDQTPPSPAWYLVQALCPGGDIEEVDATLSPIHDPSVYEEQTPLVFRDDDPIAGTSVMGTARALLSRHRTDGNP